MKDGGLVGGQFRITGGIGEGGMGDVYRGVDVQTGETVAIKLLKPDILEANPNLIERFVREGEALRRLNHPNIVKMITAVEEDDLHYLVMQYVSGGSLRDLLDRERRLPVDRVLSLGIELADALTRAHHLKIIHRDLKPENVLLDETGTPLLTDFGVARIGTRTRVTESGSLIGTYFYLSPEACMAEELDARTDIWSFGVLLFEMLAGHRPFEAEQSTAILLAIMQQPLPDLAALRPDVPPALLDLIQRMLTKDREQRIGSVRLVGAALEAIQRGAETPLPTPELRSATQESGSRFATSTPPDAELLIPPGDGSLVKITPPPELSRVQPAPPAVQARRVRPRWPALGAAAVLGVFVLIAAALSGVFGGGERAGPEDRPTAVVVEPVAPGEYMVLVADLEPLRGVAPRDVSRFIAQDLKQRLEQDVPFSTIRVRAYPQVITGDAQAQQVAQATGATVIVWGNYTPDAVELNVQVGVLTAFPLIRIDRAIIERTANVRAHLTDETRESAAALALNVLNVLLTADGNALEVTRILAVMDLLDTPQVQVVSGGVAGALHQGTMIYMQDTRRAVDFYTEAINLQASNPLLYPYRATGYLRLGEFDKALVDIETADSIGPQSWAVPLYTRGTYEVSRLNVEDAIATYGAIIERRPDDWFAYGSRGALYYLRGEYELARADLDRAIALGPTADFPYLVGMTLALRQAEFDDLVLYLDAMKARGVDPDLLDRLLSAMFGDSVPNIFTPFFAAGGHLLLRQYETALGDIDNLLALNDQLPDAYLLQGVAYCSLHDYPAAEAAYTQGLALDPGYTALYALRSEARQRQGDLEGALEDARTVQTGAQAAAYAPLLQAAVAGDWSCETLFDYDYSSLGDAHGQQ